MSAAATAKAPSPRDGVAARPGRDRSEPIGNLKALMVGWIIFGHALLGYTRIGGWPYDEVQEVVMSPGAELVVILVMGPSALFIIGSFFFLAGMFAPRALSRRGPGHFVRSRLLRLGVPWVATMLLVWPFFMWLAYRAAGHRLTFWQTLVQRHPLLDSGQLWFVEVLLYVSLGYAWWVGAAPARWRGAARLSGRHLAVAVVLIAGTSFLVRLEFPARSQQVLDLHLWQWPQCVGMFCLGALASGRGWTRRVPARVSRQAGVLTVATLTALPLIAVAAGLRDVSAQGAPFLGGWHLQALVLDLAEANLTVFGSVWLLAAAQRRLTSSSRLWRRASGAAYAAFVLQGPALITLEVLLRPVPFTGGVKALLVGAVAVPASFALGALLHRRRTAGRTSGGGRGGDVRAGHEGPSLPAGGSGA
jgi:hypothetical protein